MNSIKLTAPAKVNLFLKILNKRKDSYHNILTLFERISLADELTISKIPKGIEVTSDKFITADPKSNLVYKAARLILEIRGDKGRIGVDKGTIRVGRGLKIEEDRGVSIRIKKRIPIAAGLGGGSSDAASTIIGINRLYRLGLNKGELVKLARRLGADVAFFITQTPFAVGRGVGDVLREYHIRLKLYHVIIYPGFKVAAKDIYEEYDRRSRGLTIRHPNVKINRLLNNVVDINSVESMLRNDLEDTVVSKRAVIRGVIERLAQLLKKKAIVSGSGPSVFCLYGTRKEAIEAKRRLMRAVPPEVRRGWQIFVAETADAY